MLTCLYRRLLALDPDNLPREALASFDLALGYHDPQHWRYLSIQGDSAVARLNAAKNPLFPRSINLVLKRASKN